MRVTAPSTCPWLDHPVSGLILVTSSRRKPGSRPLQTRFRCAYTSRLKLATKTNSLTHYTKGTPSGRSQEPGARDQKKSWFLPGAWFLTPRPPTACRRPVSGTLSLPSSGCFSPFPHGTRALSVTEEYLGLEGGPPIFRQGFSCPALLEDLRKNFPVRDSHPLRPALPGASGSPFEDHWPRPLSLATTRGVSREPPRGNPLLMSFPPATEMFQFAGFASRTYLFSTGYPGSTPGWVAPFGNPGITDRSHLPLAFRSVLRPSSPLSAKASPGRPSLRFSLPILEPSPRTGPRRHFSGLLRRRPVARNSLLHCFQTTNPAPHAAPQGGRWWR